MRRTALSVLLVAVGIAGCASAGPEANRTRFQRNVGMATPQTARELAHRIITQYGFVIELEQTTTDLMIQTRWRDRAPFKDEEALGISHAQNRMFISARRRSATVNAQTYQVDVVIENRVQLAGSTAWTDASATKEYEKWANRIAEDFSRELNVGGVRR